MKQETADAIQKLYEKLLVDLAEATGMPCDVLMMAHPQHGNEPGECQGMSLHSNADPVQAHKLAFSALMWAENNLHQDQMMHPGTARLN